MSNFIVFDVDSVQHMSSGHLAIILPGGDRLIQVRLYTRDLFFFKEDSFR